MSEDEPEEKKAAIPPRRRLLRRAVPGLAAALVLLPLLMLVGGRLALRSAGLRRALLDRAAVAARQLGMELAVADFKLRGWNGVELSGVRVGRIGGVGGVGARPFATAKTVMATVDLGSVRSATVVVRSLEITAPRIDLTAPIPEIPQTQGPSGFAIRRLAIHRGEIAGAPLAGAAADWVRSWRVAGLEAHGAFVAERWGLTVDHAEAVVERPGFAPQSLRISGNLAYADGGPLEISGAEIHGDGLALSASGAVGLDEKMLTALTFKATAEPRLLVAGTPPGGSLTVEGHLRRPTGTTTAKLTARDVPAEALRPFVEAKLFTDLALAGTVADVQADLLLGPDRLERLTGKAEAAWHRGERRLARAVVQVGPGGKGEPAIRLTFAADLLPGSPGSRRATGTVQAERWEDLAAAPIAAAGSLRLPDVAAALAEVRSLWPRLVPPVPAGVPLQGILAADLKLDGVLTSPKAALDALWTPQPGARVRLVAQGSPRTLAGSARAELENLPLALLSPVVPGLTGNATGNAEISGVPGAYKVQAATEVSSVAFPPQLQRLDSARVEVRGVLKREAFAGTIGVDGAGLDIPDTVEAPSFHLAADGVLPLGGGALSRSGRGAVDARGRVGEGAFRLDVPQALLLSAPAGFTDLRDLHIIGSADAREVRIATLAGSFPGGPSFSGSGRALLEPLLAEADLSLYLARPVDAVRSAEVSASLRSGLLTVVAPRIDTDAGPASLRAAVPLGALRRIPQLTEALSGLPFALAEGPVVLHLSAPSLDSIPLLAALKQPPRSEHVRTGVEADLTFDPAAPAAGEGTVRLDGLTAETPDGRIAAEGPLTLRLGEGRLEILPVRLHIAAAGLQGAGVDLRGRADLAPAWRPFDDPPAAAVRSVSFAAGGTIDAALLNPYLQGGAASGTLSFSVDASGPPDHLVAVLKASGPGASFLWAAPYATRVQDPDLAASLRDGHWTIDRGRLLLNDGTVDLAGQGDLGGSASLEAALSGVRYSFDYGLSTVLSGRLALAVPPEGHMRLGGRLVVDRGLLDRDVNLDREVLDMLRRPVTPGTEESVLDAIDLDLAVATVDGVRIRNNVADLRAAWSPLSVTGTAAAPVIKGRIEIDPDGRFTAYGQIVRIDRGALVFTGDPQLDPQLDVATTSSFEDPTIGPLSSRDRPLDLLTAHAVEKTGIAAQKMATTGLASYLGDRFAASVGLRRLSVRPVLVFGETDPSARLSVGGDLSANVSFALSVDLRNAEARTYLLDLHGFRELPGLTLQGFTNDAGHEGATLQQALDFGGSKPREAGRRLRRLRIDAPKGISKRAVRRAIRLEKKAPVPAGAAFDVEIDVADFLRRKGYPDPRVSVAVTPVEGNGERADVAVTVEPGPQARFLFTGDRPPRNEREAITTLYRTDFYEPVSLEEMKKAAVRAFRSRGHLDPQVEVTVETTAGPRSVTIHTAAGPRLSLGELAITGVEPEPGALAAGRFPGVLARAELAAALPAADRRLLDALRTLGYPAARITGRAVEKGGDRLAVQVDPGERQILGAVTVAGAGDETERQRLAGLLAPASLRPGAPARLDLAAAGALLLERDLRDSGFPDAAVRTVFRAADPARPRVLALTYEVTEGPRVRVADVGFSGERWSRPAQLARVAGLETGAPFDAGAVDAARSRLLDSGVFSRVTTNVERAADSSQARVTFSLLERPRFHFGYGVRSESGGSTAGVLDFIDSNFLGRAMTLGLRALYEPDDRSGRLYLQTGGLFGTPSSLESFVQARRQTAGDNLLEDSREAALQLARPFGRAATGRLYARYRSTHLFEKEPDLFVPFDIRIDHPYLGAQALWDSRDNPVDPARGLFASADLSGSGSFLGSDFEYARLFTQASLYRPLRLAGRPLTWAQSVRLGVARAFAGQELLRDERFFAGGAFSVRGYDTKSLGPQETLGTLVRPLGGEALLLVNEELRVPLPFDLTGLLFADIGQVWDRLRDVDTNLSTSLGLGLRARTPVGLVRLDVGFPLDRRPGDQSYRLYFGFGNAF